ncbi:hypothetical protein KL921_003885 [Ogataea angusta]|uniref:Peroxin 17 n=1 Tax=Pichia angusta TaxID=870730 RepID=A0AAN6I4P5_PICAN|nr:uncharacterized protein KL928_004126 [Ogataea angusta]KAG7808803.1 hypothetical protein KL921_003885 [Ogataea angusta]KAG7817391.1 hypothetical protein KL928_004126 [Ogataea angusta]KAG7839124.1 hypothetical protein KL942_003486 [Ogataea angusta]KAG7849765.1 hypothetical protein KL940_002795 [Ogataea angusta]
MAVAAIAFPEDAGPVSPVRPHGTLRYVLRLLASSGYGLAAFYAVVLLVIKPMLRLSFERRRDLANHCFGHLRALYGNLVDKVKFVPSVELNYRGLLYKDSMCSTETDEDDVVVQEEHTRGVRFDDEVARRDYNELNLSQTVILGQNLDRLKDTLNKIRVSSYHHKNSVPSFGGRLGASDVSEMQPLIFQVKQLKNCVEMVSTDHPREYLFKRSLSYARGPNKLNLVDDLRDELADLRRVVQQAKNR